MDVIQTLYRLLEPLTHVPVNIWPWLFLLVLPILVFSAKPQHSVWWRIGRLLLAIIIGYVLLNLMLQTQLHLKWQEYHACFAKWGIDFSVEIPGDLWQLCGQKAPLGVGAKNIFYIYASWIFAVAYVGLWDRVWYHLYRKKIASLGKAYKGTWFSWLVVVISVPVWLWTIFAIGTYALLAICPPFIPTHTCLPLGLEARMH